jgi:predicted acylesterase/phospholipase RssA
MTSGLNSIPLRVPVPPVLVERLYRTRVAQAFNIFLQSVDVSSRALAEMRLKADNPDVVIRPDVDGIGLLDKVDILKVTQKGEEAARFALPELQRAVAWPNRLKRRLFHQN